MRNGFSTILILIIAVLFLAGAGGFVFLDKKVEKSETNDKKYFETKNGQSREQKNNFFSDQEKHEIFREGTLIPEITPLRVSPLPPPSVSKSSPIILPTPQQSIPEVAPLTQPAATPLTSPTHTSQFPTATQIAEFSDWANGRGITLQAVSASVDDMYYNRYNPAAHNISLGKISGLMTAHYALKNLPGFILDTMRDKTIYFSTSNERPYTNLTGDYGGTLKNTKAGFILTQPISEDATLHELGHIVGYHGIEGLYGFAAPFADLKKEYDELFDTIGVSYPPPATPKGYISSYATANKAENFAEHFAYYVFHASQFKAKMAGDDLLTKKYDFFDKKIFLPSENRQITADCENNTSPVFTNDITDISKVSYVVPPPTMGSGPSLKTHSYIGTNGQRVPVLAPTDIVLKAGSHSVGGPYGLEFQVSCEVNIRFGHITEPLDSIKNLLPKEPQLTSQTQEVSPIYFKAGDLIGYTTGTTAAGNWDFGAYDSSKNNRYISDPDWNWSDTYTKAVCPFDYFSPNLKLQYYSRFNSQTLGGNPPHGDSFCQ